MNYQAKVVWITGASSGIGETLAYELAKRGARLILSARREAELERVKQATALKDQDVLVLPLDLMEHDKMWEKVSLALKHFGSVDLLVNNGGLSQRSLVMDTEMSVYQRLIDINYLGTVALTKALLPQMIRQGHGQIAVVTSLVGKFGTPLRSGYAAAKHALHGFFDSLRAEVWEQGIRVTIICPGFIQTNVSRNAVVGDGSSQGTMDQATANGLTAETCARKMADAIAKQKEEIYIGKREKYGVYLKRFFPRLFSKMLRKTKVT